MVKCFFNRFPWALNSVLIEIFLISTAVITENAIFGNFKLAANNSALLTAFHVPGQKYFGGTSNAILYVLTNQDSMITRSDWLLVFFGAEVNI